MAVVRAPVACGRGFRQGLLQRGNERAEGGLARGEVSLASSAVSLAMYALMPAAALLVDSVCSGVSVLMTPALIGLMILQSAAETPVAAAEAAGRKPACWRPPTWSRRRRRRSA